MHPVDTLRIHFNADQLVILNMAMAFLMFSVALDIRLSDFRQVVKFPRSVFAGLLVQYLLFPLLTLAIIYLFKPPVSVAMGMVLVCMCPSGNMTNFLVHYSKANIALSVTLNAIIILSASFITPAGFLFWSRYVDGAVELRRSFSIGFGEMAWIIVQLIVIPLLVGMVINSRFPEVTARIRPWAQRLALVIFFSILILAVAANSANVMNYLGFVFVLVAVHNGVALFTGYSLGRLFGLPESDSRALCFESGIHNTALGLLLIFRFFDGLGGMALIAAWWGIWDLITGFSLAAWWRRSAA
jgi:BASS family bile acid:Na+ symporter